MAHSIWKAHTTATTLTVASSSTIKQNQSPIEKWNLSLASHKTDYKHLPTIISKLYFNQIDKHIYTQHIIRFGEFMYSSNFNYSVWVVNNHTFRSKCIISGYWTICLCGRTSIFYSQIVISKGSRNVIYDVEWDHRMRWSYNS